MSSQSVVGSDTERSRFSLGDLALWAGPSGVALLARLANGPLTVDDAFITMRYAEHLRAGRGLIYNQGEAVLGTTTPLYATLLSLMPVPAGSLPLAALCLNSLADAAVCLLLVWLGARLGGKLWIGALAASGYALAPMSIAFSAGGMESPVFVLLVLSAFALYLRGSSLAAMLVAAFATLTRPEAVLVAALILLHLTWERRRRPWLPGIGYAALLAPWALYALAVYGSPIPHSVTAKAATYNVSPLLNLGALAFGAGLPGFSVLPLADSSANIVVPLGLTMLGLVVLYGLARQGSRLALSRTSLALPLLLFAPLYALAYALAGLRGVRMFHWYLVPLLPFYVLYLALGVGALVGRGGGRVPWAVPAAFLLLALWNLAALGISRGQLDRPTYPVGLVLVREHAYLQAGTALRARLQPGEAIAAPEIGALGYASGAPILDTVGLVSPGISRYYPLPAEMLVGDNAVPPALIQEAQPRYLVALEQFVRRSVQESQWFRDHYDIVDRYPARVWESEEVLVFRRNDRP